MIDLQQKMLDMVCEIDAICKKHKIEYCLYAGSGLGVERHKGFIPWDDDADILMTLENYEKFLEVFDQEAMENRVLNCLEKSTDYPFTYARYVDTQTSAIQRHTAFGGCDPGVKIDIFIAVPTDDNPKKAEQHRQEILAFSETICPYAFMFHYRSEGFAKAYAVEQKLYKKYGREKYITKRLSELKHYTKNKTGHYVLFSGMMCNSFIFPAEILDEMQYAPFENTELMVSKQNIKLNSALYFEGWFNKPQGVDSRVHTYLLDLEKPYREYLDLLWEKYDYEKAEKTAAARRKNHLIQRDEFRDVHINTQQLKNLAVEISTKEGFRRLSETEKTNWSEVYEVFSSYYETQSKWINRFFELFIDLNDEEIFEAAVNAAVMTNRYYRIADVVNRGLEIGRFSADDKKMQPLISRIDACRTVTEALYFKTDLDRLKDILSKIDDPIAKESLTVKIAELWLRAISAEKDDLQKICGEIDRYCEEFYRAGELLVIKGYCLEKMGDPSADKIYREALATAANAFVYQYLTDRGFGENEGNQ